MTVAPAAIGILTVSDRARRGQYEDKGGPAIEAGSLGRGLARRMQSAGAETLLERLRQEAAAGP